MALPSDVTRFATHENEEHPIGIFWKLGQVNTLAIHGISHQELRPIAWNFQNMQQITRQIIRRT